MLDPIQSLRERITGSRDEEPDRPDPGGFTALQVLAAQMLLLTGVGSTLDSLSRARGDQHRNHPLDYERYTPAAGSFAAWVPSLVAPLAAAAHLRHTVRPTPATATATRVLDAAVIGAGVAGLAGAVASLRRTGGLPSLIPAALAAAGVLGLALDRQERAVAEERDRLERRARVVERLVPRRRPRLERVVVHV